MYVSSTFTSMPLQLLKQVNLKIICNYPLSLLEDSVRIFMVTPCINEIKMLYCPPDELNFISCRILKHIKNLKTAPTCFGSRRNYHQGAKVSA